MQSYESGGAESLSLYSIQRHLLLLHPGIPATCHVGSGHVPMEMKMHNRKQWLCLETAVLCPGLGCSPKPESVLSRGLAGEGTDAFYSY